MNFIAYKEAHRAEKEKREEEFKNKKFVKIGRINYEVIEDVPPVSVENYGERRCSMIVQKNGSDGLRIYNPQTGKLSSEDFARVQRIITNLFFVTLMKDKSKGVYVDDAIVDEQTYVKEGLGIDLDESIKNSDYEEHVANDSISKISDISQNQPQ